MDFDKSILIPLLSALNNRINGCYGFFCTFFLGQLANQTKLGNGLFLLRVYRWGKNDPLAGKKNASTLKPVRRRETV